MKTVHRSKEALYTIEGSRFISELHPVNSKEEADDIIKSIRKAHPKATHVVSAVRMAEEGYYDDDGEPAQTAGAPLLSLLEGEEIVFALITSVRYFGGTKLGKGGLIRAYSESGREAIRLTEFLTLHNVTQFFLTFDYAEQGVIDHLLTTFGAFRGPTDYSANIRTKVYFESVNGFRQKFLDATQGRGLIEKGERVYIYRSKEQIVERGNQ